MRWPKSRGKPSIDPKVWTFGTSVGNWRRFLNFAHPQSIRQRCIVDLSVSSSVQPLVAKGRNGRSERRGQGQKSRLPGNKANGNWPSVPFWTGAMNASAVEDAQYNHPITGDPDWSPSTAADLHSVRQNCDFMSCSLVGRSRRLIPPHLGVVAILARFSCSLCRSSHSRLRRNIDSQSALESSYHRQEARAG